MGLKLSLIVMALLAATTNAQLLCYQCDDCTMQIANVQPCGINYETIAPPDGTTTIGPPITTTVMPPETTTVEPITTTLQPPVTTNPTTDGPPTPTLPTTISTTVASSTNGLPTVPVTPMTTAQSNSRLVISLEPPHSYVCITIKSIVTDREVVRRGCAQLGPTVADTCNSASGGQHVSCSVCMTHLCNYA